MSPEEKDCCAYGKNALACRRQSPRVFCSRATCAPPALREATTSRDGGLLPFSWRGEAASRRAHNPKIAGAIPAAATSLAGLRPVSRSKPDRRARILQCARDASPIRIGYGDRGKFSSTRLSARRLATEREGCRCAPAEAGGGIPRKASGPRRIPSHLPTRLIRRPWGNLGSQCCAGQRNIGRYPCPALVA